MSATPITDAATFNVPCHGADGTGSRVAVVPYQVCRDLERQLAEKTDAIQDAANLVDEWRNRARRDRDKSVEWEEKHNALERQLAETPWGANSETKDEWLERQREKYAYLERQLATVTKQRDALAEALKMWKAEGPESNACFCDAHIAMHGAHPSHSEECKAATEALANLKGDKP